MNIQTSANHRFGKSIQFTIGSEKVVVKFDSQGFGLVEEQLINSLLIQDSSLSKVENLTDSNDNNKKTPDPNAELRKMYESQKKADLIDVAEALELDKASYSNLNKADLIDLLIENDNQSDDEEIVDNQEEE